MKSFRPILNVLAIVVIMLSSGCMTCESVSRGRRRVARGKEEFMKEQKRRGKYDFAFLKLKNIKGQELRDDFEVVFRDSEFLSPTTTPARVALADHFLYYDEKVPSSEQCARLIDAILQNHELIRPLETVWLSHHVTLTQRVAVAKKIDSLRKGKPDNYMYYNELAFPMRNPWVLKYILPSERMTDDDYRVVQRQVDPKGEVYAFIEHKIAKRREWREKWREEASYLDAHKWR